LEVNSGKNNFFVTLVYPDMGASIIKNLSVDKSLAGCHESLSISNRPAARRQWRTELYSPMVAAFSGMALFKRR
jgi:hypothetical protein